MTEMTIKADDSKRKNWFRWLLKRTILYFFILTNFWFEYHEFEDDVKRWYYLFMLLEDIIFGDQIL